MTWPRWRDLSWARKLAALLLPLAILPVAAVTFFNEQSIRDEFVRESRARNLLRAQNTAALIARYVDDVVGDVTVLARAPVTTRVLAEPGDPVGLAELRVTMEILRQTRHIEVLQVLNHEGIVVASTRAALVGRRRDHAPYFLSAIAGHAGVQDPRYQPDDAAEHINVAVPVTMGQRRAGGVAVARLSLEDVDRLVAADTNFGSLDEFGLLFDANGIVISSPAHPEERFHPLAALDPVTRARLIAEQRFGPDTVRWIDAPAGAAPLVARAARRQADSAAVDVPLMGEWLQAVTTPVADTRWTYAVVMADGKLMAAIGRQRRHAAAVAGATALVGLLIAGAFAGWLSRPLNRVQDAAHAIASGDLSRRTGITGRDEVGRLAEAFDAMADSLVGKDAELRRHAESLERRVEERTAELRGLLHAVPDLIFKVSAGGVLLDHVAAKEDPPAPPPDLLIGRPLSEIMPPRVAAATLQRIHRALGGEPVEPFEYALPSPAGDRQFEARVSPSGRDAVLILVRDVTERRRHDDRTRFLARAAESLALSLDYGSTLETLARLPVPFLADLCIVDLIEHGQVRIGAVAASNPETEALAAAVRRQYPLRLDAPVALRRGPRLFRDCRGETFREVAQNEDHLRLIARMGMTSAMVLPLLAGGQTLGSMLFVSSSIRRRYSEADLALAGELADRAGIAIDNARLYRELQESSRLKDEFLGTVSHELRTPLNAVLGWTMILRKGATDPSVAARALSAIERNARAQAQLVEDLLDTSRIVSGKLRIDMSPIDISGIVQGAAESFGPLARARGTDLGVTCEDGLPPVLADTVRLQQVIGNLLANALKFTPAGGHVAIQAQRSTNGVEISVRDTGAGIPPDLLPFVFDRFRQGDSTTTRAHGGLGLGLAIARHLVELHGGTIRAESSGEHTGATVTIELPVAAARHSARGEPPADASPCSVAGVRVLAVDDQEDARALLQTLLADAGAIVDTAASAPDGLRALTDRRPDVLVADIAMPGEDGYSLIRALRRDESARGLPRLPAIALTAYARDDDRRRAEAAGFDRHLSKPVDAAALVGAVAQLISGSAAS